jgi:hypothetical protein
LLALLVGFCHMALIDFSMPESHTAVSLAAPPIAPKSSGGLERNFSCSRMLFFLLRNVIRSWC